MTLVDGVETETVNAADRGLNYGDGVYRTLRFRSGAPVEWPRHFAKLASDCAALSIPVPAEPLLKDELLRVGNTRRDCVVKVIVTRGISGRGYRYETGLAPTRIVTSAPLPDYPAAHCDSGVHVRRCALRLSDQPALAGVKHLNRLENVIARAEWTDPAVAEGLLRDAAGNVIGGTMTNLFIVRDGVLATPRLDRCGVAGVTRDRVVEAAARHDILCDVTDLSWDDVLGAEELFLVNSLAGVWPVCSIEECVRTPGPVTRAMQKWIDG